MMIGMISLVMAVSHMHAQINPKTSSQQDSKKISIHSENNQVIDATTDPATQYLNGDVKVYHAGTFMFCDSAILRGPDLRMHFNVVLLQNDTIRIFADSLKYNGDSLVAYLYGNIILENGFTKKLFTTYLKYDVRNKIAYYTRNARLVDGTSTLISRRGKYFLNDKTAYFYENVSVKGDDFDLISDSLSYNTITQETRFLAPVRINKDTSRIYSERGWFDLDDKVGDFIGNAQYMEGKTIAKADTITYNGELDVVILKGDTMRSEYISEKDTAYAKVIYYDQKNEIFRLTKDAWYKGEKNEVSGDKILYDKKQKSLTLVVDLK
jgi:lipopolysaccharide transport protein LptA